MTDRAAEDEIRALIAAGLAATGARDAGGATARFAGDAVAFDVVGPLRQVGADEIRARAEAWLATFDAPVAFEVRDLRVLASGDVAFSYCLSHARGSLARGGTLDMWWRRTMCWQKIDGRWTVVHTHDSVPFDPTTGRPSLGLAP